MTDDAQLLRQYCEARSEAAFAELVERHLGLVYHCALRRLGGDAHLAQDTAQVVFVLLAAKARPLLGHPSLAGWLYSTALFKASEMLRTERRRKQREEAAVAMREDHLESVAPAEPGQIRELLDKVILELNERDREAIVLRYFEGHAYAEIACRIALTEKAARKRVDRALAQLRRKFARRGIASGAEALGLILSDQIALGAPAGLAARVTGAAMASPGPAAALSALKLMTATKMTTGGVAIAGLLLVGLGVQEGAALKRTTSDLTTSQQESAILTDQLRKLEQKSHVLEADRLASQSDSAYFGSGLSSAPEAEDRGSGTEGSASENQRRANMAVGNALSGDPQVHQLLGKLVDFRNAVSVGPTLKAAGLSEAQIQRAEFLAGQEVTFDPLGPYPLSFKTLSQPWNEISTEIQQTLGTDGTAALHTFMLNSEVVGGLAASLSDTDSPLTPQQASQLTQVLVNTNQANNPGGGWYMPQTTDWSAALAQAGQFLSPAQLANLKDMAVGRFGSTAP